MPSLIDLMPPQVKIAAAALAVLAVFIAGWTGRSWLADAQIANIRTTIAQQREVAVQQARAIERQQQEVVNHALREQNETLAAVAAGLQRDLDRLRNRPERPAASMPAAARPACACGTGAGLCREDAEFLVREAARADDLRAGLGACYEVIDGLR